MATGLISLGQDLEQSAIRAGDTAVALEGARNREQQMAKGAEKQQNVGMALSGAAVGAQVGGPIGAGVGFLAGLAGSALF